MNRGRIIEDGPLAEQEISNRRPRAGCRLLHGVAQVADSDRRGDDAAAALFVVSKRLVDHVEYRKLRIVAEVVAGC